MYYPKEHLLSQISLACENIQHKCACCGDLDTIEITAKHILQMIEEFKKEYPNA